MRTLPPLNALRVFEAAARRGSFKLAAEELFITPTAVSHQIRQLEERMGVALFRRDPKPIALTEAGRELFPAVRDALDRIASGVASAQAIRSPKAIVVTTTPAFASYWLIPRLSKAQQAIAPETIVVQATEVVVDLHAGDADVAFRYASSPSQDLVSTELLRDTYLAVCSPSLIQAHGRRSDAQSAIADLPLIHFNWKQDNPDAPSWSKWVARARQSGHDAATLPDPARGLRFSEEIHAVEATLEGQGLALLSSAIVRSAIAKGHLVKAHDFELQGLSLYAIYSASSPKRDSIEQFLKAVQT
jgi:LysR family glycine cleavage system transcriptional activator